MAIDGAEIRRRISEFVGRWLPYQGSERAEAQTFLNELFHCYGTDRQEVARFEHAQGGKFLDLIWDRVCIFEMKRPSEAGSLKNHRAQAFDYWRNSASVSANLPALDEKVLSAYGWTDLEPSDHKEVNRRLYELNAAVSTERVSYIGPAS